MILYTVILVGRIPQSSPISKQSSRIAAKTEGSSVGVEKEK